MIVTVGALWHCLPALSSFGAKLFTMKNMKGMKKIMR